MAGRWGFDREGRRVFDPSGGPRELGSFADEAALRRAARNALERRWSQRTMADEFRLPLDRVRQVIHELECEQ